MYIFSPKIPQDGAWTAWGNWSTCQSNCRSTRSRTCDFPTPMFGGADCTGNHTEEKTCSGDDCPPTTTTTTTSTSTTQVQQVQ